MVMHNCLEIASPPIPEPEYPEPVNVAHIRNAIGRHYAVVPQGEVKYGTEIHLRKLGITADNATAELTDVIQHLLPSGHRCAILTAPTVSHMGNSQWLATCHLLIDEGADDE